MNEKFYKVVLASLGTYWSDIKPLGRFVRNFWRKNKAGFALFLLTVVVGYYAYIIVYSQEVQTWKKDIEDISTFIPVAGVIVGALIGRLCILSISLYGSVFSLTEETNSTTQCTCPCCNVYRAGWVLNPYQD
ncbi:hypothetical protein C6497_07205 [Candidatus Poribacteria bacterium]|nr:MAG: hypothetical protein C6497_07205 [Candidatus Poribacteria bacterium]